jgi:uncharacterized protein
VIHPHSELRFVSPAIGFGVFATRLIPKGTITWVFDPLDQIVSPSRASQLAAPLQRHLDIYSYQNGRGHRILCWDHARFVNHSCQPTSLATGFDLEIAALATSIAFPTIGTSSLPPHSRSSERSNNLFGN